VPEVTDLPARVKSLSEIGDIGFGGRAVAYTQRRC
jgi:hypothetical protein